MCGAHTRAGLKADRYAGASARLRPRSQSRKENHSSQLTVTRELPSRNEHHRDAKADTIEERRTERAASTRPRAAVSFYPPPSPSATPVSGLQGSRAETRTPG